MLPIIDIASLAADDANARAWVARELRAAALDKGFFYVVGHGVPEPLIEQVFDQAAAFFALPEARKLAVAKSRSRANRGYEPLRGQTLEPGAPADLKEGFYIGPELSPDDPRALAGRFNQGPNQWPARTPGFRPTMEAYRAAMMQVAARLVRALAVSLDLPERALDEFCREPIALLRLLHYPPRASDGAADEKGAGAHTDFGALTLLLQDRNGGLEVYEREAGAWIDAPPIPGSFVVNLGDLVARWTNDRYRSTLHRVVNRSGRERYSVPFFFSGAPDYPIASLPSCLAPGETPRYPPTTVEAHLKACYARTYAPSPAPAAALTPEPA